MKQIFLLLFVVNSFFSAQAFLDSESKVSFVREWADSKVEGSIVLTSPEFVFERNFIFLNTSTPEDQLLYLRTFFDVLGTYSYRPAGCQWDVLKMACGIRSRFQWQLVANIPQSSINTVKDVGVVFGAHDHFIFFKSLWVRELWLQLCLNNLLNVPWEHPHYLTVGAFLYQLGRGISLGYNYPAIPTIVGAFPNNYVDQYPFGAKIWGQLTPELSYDIYGSILANRSSTFFDTNLPLRAQEFGHRNDKALGFGGIHYLFAGRLQWWPFDPDKKRAYFEPYILFDFNPDIFSRTLVGKSELVTMGLMFEAVTGCIEWGFEAAFNRGGFTAPGRDTDILTLTNPAGIIQVAHSQVVDTVDNQRALATQENDQVINSSPQTAFENNKFISPTLRNSRSRFQDPFEIAFKGYFCVLDGSYVFQKDIFRASAAVGYVSGDRDPRLKLALNEGHNRKVDYEGFLSIDELYFGKRVLSIIVLNPGAVPRLLDFGADQLQDNLVTNIIGFSNLAYVGFSCDYQYKMKVGCWHVYPNLLFFWIPEPSTQFTLNQDTETPRIISSRQVRSFLGTESNVIAEIQPNDNLLIYGIAGIFLPGSYYDDIKGVPVNQAQFNYVRNHAPREALIGNDIAFGMYIGMRYVF